MKQRLNVIRASSNLKKKNNVFINSLAFDKRVTMRGSRSFSISKSESMQRALAGVKRVYTYIYLLGTLDPSFVSTGYYRELILPLADDQDSPVYMQTSRVARFTCSTSYRCTYRRRIYTERYNYAL